MLVAERQVVFAQSTTQKKILLLSRSAVRSPDQLLHVTPRKRRNTGRICVFARIWLHKNTISRMCNWKSYASRIKMMAKFNKAASSNTSKILGKIMKKTNSSECDFGQYEELWKNHKGSCNKVIRITSDYIVCIDKNNNIDWETTKAYDSAKPHDERIESERVLSYCLITEHKPTGGLSQHAILSFKTIIGEAIVNCLERNCDGATEILKLADEFRIDRVIEKSRQWHLTFTTLPSIILVVIALLINAKNIPIWESTLPYINIGIWAVVGACLSIILRSGKLQHASYAGRWLHFVESACRLIGGFITGQIVFLGIKSGILFSSIINTDNSQYLVCLLALLAGASERFAPSIITKIDNSSLTLETSKDN